MYAELEGIHISIIDTNGLDMVTLEPLLDQISIEEMEKLYAGIAGYREVPVSIEQFIDDPYYLGDCFLKDEDGIRFYPYWREFFKQVYPNPFVNPYYLCILRGSIGRGKTVTLCIGMAYQMYRLLCMVNPQKSNSLLAGDKIVFALFNATLGLANDVVLDRLTGFFTTSPYFSGLLETHFASYTATQKRNKANKTLFPSGIDLFAGSRIGHSLGKAIFSAAIDESNFDVLNNQFFKTFNSLIARMSSRFMGKGKAGVPGQLWVASSETDNTSNLNTLLSQYRGKTGVIVSDGPIWEVKPHKFILDQWFPVYKGSETTPASVITPDTQYLVDDEPENILQCPEELRDMFEADVNAALRDQGGVSVASAYKLFKNKQKVIDALAMFTLFPDTIRLDFDNEEDTVMNHCKNIGYFSNPILPNAPRYVGLDMSVTGDRFGVAATYISGWKEIAVPDPENIMEKVTTAVPMFATDWAFAIEAKPGQQIPFDRVRSFLLWVSQNNYIIGKITTDGWNSVDMRQQCKRMGFETDLVSVDKTTVPYLTFRTAVYEDRWRGPNSTLVRREMEELEVTPNGKKIVHLEPAPGADIVASKDVCLVGDTEIPLLDGTVKTLEELYKTGVDNTYVYSCEEDGTLVPGKVEAVERTQRNAMVICVTLDNGDEIRCTPNHKFMLRDGSYKQAGDLVSGESLMPLYTKMSEKGEDGKRRTGYPMCFDNKRKEWLYVHKMVAGKIPDEYRNSLGQFIQFPVTHHKDFDKMNAHPDNLVWMPFHEHRKYHNEIAKTGGANFKRMWETDRAGCLARISAIGKRTGKKNITKYNKSPERIKKLREKGTFSKNGIKTMNALWQNSSFRKAHLKRVEVSSKKRVEEGTHNFMAGNSSRYALKDDTNVERKQRTLGKFKTNGKRLGKQTADRLKSDPEFAKQRAAKISKALKRLITDVCPYCDEEKVDVSVSSFAGHKRHCKKRHNHKVISVATVGKKYDVYDLTVEKYHNFALSAGVFVHNCDAIAQSIVTLSNESDKYRLFDYAEYEGESKSALPSHLMDEFWPDR